MKSKEIGLIFISAVAILFLSWFINSIHSTAFAAQMYSATSYASSTYNIQTGNITIFAWVNKTSDANLDFVFDQGAAGLGDNLSFIQKGAVGHHEACSGNSGQADMGVAPNYGVWQFIACTFDGTNIVGYDFYMNGDLRATASAAGTLAATNGFIVGAANGGTNTWNGAIRNLTVVHGALTQQQLRKIVLSRNPYSVVSPELFCPLTSDVDNRCFTGAKEISLKMFNTPTSKIDPPIGLYTF